MFARAPPRLSFGGVLPNVFLGGAVFSEIGGAAKSVPTPLERPYRRSLAEHPLNL